MYIRIGKHTNTLLAAVSGSLKSIADWIETGALVIDLRRTVDHAWQGRPDDIFVVTYPRSGTTLMQMMLYQLTTDGSMDFQHIGMVVPWFERRIQSNPDAALHFFANLPSPRVFKSHLHYVDIPKQPGKYIYVMRNGEDVLVSYYHFYRSHLSYQGSFDDFFTLFMQGRVQFQSWFQHVHEWWKHRHDPNILFLHYEEIIADLGGTLRTVADFCGIDVASHRWPIIQEQCDFPFMKRHENKFDHTMGLALDRGYQLDSFIRQGKKGAGKTFLTKHQLELFTNRLQKELGELQTPSTT
ncbi:MAG: sulfotransferase domain-containing protein [Magnetococcus sp. YQC-5]